MADNQRNKKSKEASVYNPAEEVHFSENFIEDRMFLLASIVESSDDRSRRGAGGHPQW